MQLLPLVEKMNHSPGGGRLVVTSAGELAFLAGAACAAGDEVFLNYFDGQEASTPERVLAHYGFEPGAVAEQTQTSGDGSHHRRAAAARRDGENQHADREVP